MSSFMQYDEWSRWPLRALITGSPDGSGYPVSHYFAELSRPSLKIGPQLLMVLDLTADAPNLELNGGEIFPDGTLNYGPGEVLANIGSEGQYCRVRLKDGTDLHEIVKYITVNVSISTPTPDELYPEAAEI